MPAKQPPMSAASRPGERDVAGTIWALDSARAGPWLASAHLELADGAGCGEPGGGPTWRVVLSAAQRCGGGNLAGFDVAARFGGSDACRGSGGPVRRAIQRVVIVG